MLTYENRDKMEGEFQHGNLHGLVLVTFASGRSRRALYQHGTILRWLRAAEELEVELNLSQALQQHKMTADLDDELSVPSGRSARSIFHAHRG